MAESNDGEEQGKPSDAPPQPRMSVRQQRLLIGGVVVALLLGLVPPWRVPIPSIGYNAYREFDLGYALLFTPPDTAKGPPALAGRSARIDLPVLLFEWAAVAGVTAGVYFALANKPS